MRATSKWNRADRRLTKNKWPHGASRLFDHVSPEKRHRDLFCSSFVDAKSCFIKATDTGQFKKCCSRFCGGKASTRISIASSKRHTDLVHWPGFEMSSTTFSGGWCIILDHISRRDYEFQLPARDSEFTDKMTKGSCKSLRSSKLNGFTDVRMKRVGSARSNYEISTNQWPGIFRRDGAGFCLSSWFSIALTGSTASGRRTKRTEEAWKE